MAAQRRAGGQDEALAILSKYTPSFARRLKRPEALTMLKTEFQLSDADAEMMFEAFDKDQNEVLSLWEFRQFYQTIGSDAQKVIQTFRKLEVDGSGVVDMDKTFDELRGVESAKGKLEDEDIERLLKLAAGDSKSIDFPKFLNLMCRIKVYKG